MTQTNLENTEKQSLLQRILGWLNPTRVGPTPLSRAELRQIEEALTRLVLEPPEAVRATLVSSDGLLVGCFPKLGEADRISAMSAAMLSLGERICSELGSGDLSYTIIAGAKTLQLLVVLSQDYALELELRRNVSIDSALSAVQESVAPLLQTLKIEGTKTSQV